MSNLANIQQLKQSRKFMKRLSLILRLLVAGILIIFAIFPVLWILSASLNPSSSLATQKLIPNNWGFDNFRTLLNSDVFPFWTWWWKHDLTG